MFPRFFVRNSLWAAVILSSLASHLQGKQDDIVVDSVDLTGLCEVCTEVIEEQLLDSTANETPHGNYCSGYPQPKSTYAAFSDLYGKLNAQVGTIVRYWCYQPTVNVHAGVLCEYSCQSIGQWSQPPKCTPMDSFPLNQGIPSMQPAIRRNPHDADAESVEVGLYVALSAFLLALVCIAALLFRGTDCRSALARLYWPSPQPATTSQVINESVILTFRTAQAAPPFELGSKSETELLLENGTTMSYPPSYEDTLMAIQLQMNRTADS